MTLYHSRDTFVTYYHRIAQILKKYASEIPQNQIKKIITSITQTRTVIL